MDDAKVSCVERTSNRSISEIARYILLWLLLVVSFGTQLLLLQHAAMHFEGWLMHLLTFGQALGVACTFAVWLLLGMFGINRLLTGS